jgi:hypothetical protein
VIATVSPILKSTWIRGEADAFTNDSIAIADIPHLSFIRIWREDDMIQIGRCRKAADPFANPSWR